MKKRILHLAVEVLIAITLICMLLYWADHNEITDTKFSLRWVGLGIATGVAFGYPMKLLRAYWSLKPFWLCFVLLMITHMIVYVIVLSHIKVDMASLKIFLITMAEAESIYVILKRVGTSPRFH